MKRNIIIKTICLMAVFIIGNAINNAISTYIETTLAINQLSNYYELPVFLQMYSNLKNYAFLVFILLVLIVFHKEIHGLYTKFTNKKEKKS